MNCYWCYFTLTDTSCQLSPIFNKYNYTDFGIDDLRAIAAALSKRYNQTRDSDDNYVNAAVQPNSLTNIFMTENEIILSSNYTKSYSPDNKTSSSYFISEASSTNQAYNQSLSSSVVKKIILLTRIRLRMFCLSQERISLHLRMS